MAGMGDRRGAFRVSMGRPEGKSRLGRLWPRWDEVSQRRSSLFILPVECSYEDKMSGVYDTHG